MFTGIVTHTGRILSAEPRAHGRVLRIVPDFPVVDLALGASVAHDGICLTVMAKGGEWYEVFVHEETLSRTTAGTWQPGRRINLERSLKLGDEFGGHLVFGHIDAIGRIIALDRVGEGWRMLVAMPEELAPLVAVKGSIAIDGISLTVTEAGPDRFGVALVPHTFERTTLSDRRPGDAVNLEADMLARYVMRQMQFRDLPSPP